MDRIQIKTGSPNGLESNELLTLTEKELKKEELISVLAGLIKNYAVKQQQNK